MGLAKAFRLGWAGFLYIFGLIPWWYRKGFWLDEFNQFWTRGPHNRAPFTDVDDFEQYRQHLAKQFRAAQFDMPRDPINAAKVWRDPTAACHLFSFISRRELHPLRFIKWMYYLPWKGNVLEYGAGAAPLADGLDKRWPLRRPMVTVADIPWVLHDYQRWRFQRPEVEVMTLKPDGPLMASGAVFDGILCVETLEHVPDPLMTARRLMSMLKKGGVLICDYGKQTKNQPFAPRGLTSRAVTLRYLLSAGQVLHKPYFDGDLIVIQKL